MINELLPGVACCLDDLEVSFEDAVGEPIGTKVLPDVFDGVEFGCPGRQKDWRYVVGYVEVGRCVPSGPVKKENGVGATGDTAGDLIEMQLQGLSVSIWLTGVTLRKASDAISGDDIVTTFSDGTVVSTVK